MQQAALPARSGDAGAAVDTSKMGSAKVVTVRGPFTGSVMIEATGCPEGAERRAFATVLSFASAGQKRLYMPTEALRVNMKGLGEPSVIVEGEDGVVHGAALPVPAHDGVADAVPLAEGLADAKLVCVSGRFLGTLAVELEEGGRWRALATFTKPGALLVEGRGAAARVRRRNCSGMGIPAVSICAVVPPPAPPVIEEAEDLFVA